MTKPPLNQVSITGMPFTLRLSYTKLNLGEEENFLPRIQLILLKLFSSIEFRELFLSTFAALKFYYYW